MSSKLKTKMENASDENRIVVTRNTAILFGAAMLIIGFIGGTVFGIIKTSPLGGAKQTTSTGIPPQMIQSLETEVSQNPKNVNAWIDLGNAYFDGEQYQKAIHAYESSLALEPNNANVLNDLGVMYRRSKQPHKAVEVFSRAMTADPKHETSRLNKGIVLLYDLKDEQGAVEAWEDLLAINPLAVFSNDRSVDELVRHYKEGHEDNGEKTANDQRK